MNFDCFPNLIGLTDKECPCHEIPAAGKKNITTSTSGEFITDYIDINVAAVQDCDTATDMFDQMEKARSKAEKILLSDLQESLRRRYTSTPQKFVNEVGTKVNQSSITETELPTAGMKWSCKAPEGVYARIISVDLRTGTTQDRKLLYVIDSTGAILFQSQELDLEANVTKTVDVNLRVPLFWNESETLEYYIVCDATDMYKTKASCGCGGHASKHKAFFTPTGTKPNFSAILTENYQNSASAWGVTAKVEIECPLDEGICDSSTAEDQEVIARTWAWRAAQWIAEDKLKNNDIGKYTLLSTEGLVALVNQASEEYETGLQWLVNNMAKPACMKCKPGAFKAPIRIT